MIKKLLTKLIVAAIMKRLNKHPGNDSKYDSKSQPKRNIEVLKGKKILFLGSSVTLGFASCGVSFADYFRDLDGVDVVKEAVNGTTLVTQDETSYIPRLRRVKTDMAFDAVVCQLSTNDAKQDMPFGDLNSNTENDIAGAIMTIIDYVRAVWNCPVIFYTGSRFDNDRYGKMVSLLYEIADKKKIGIIDLWNDEELNVVPQELKDLYILEDGVHPTKAGYLEWWFPFMEKRLIDIISKKQGSDK